MLHWDGKTIPTTLRSLPPGDYFIEPCVIVLSPANQPRSKKTPGAKYEKPR